MKKTYTLLFLLTIGIFIAGCGATSGTPVEITTGDLPAGQVAGPYVAAMKAKGGTSPYNWTLKKGNWPKGVTLNTTSGAVTGSPTETGTFPVIVGVADSSIPPTTTTQSFTLQVATLQVVITTTSLPSGAVSLPYSTTLGAANGASPYTWSVTSGQLPPGLSLQTGGQISGTASQAGTFAFALQVKDSAGSTATGSLSINIASPSTPVVNSISPSSGPISGGTLVTLSGANFAAGASVTFGGSAASSVVVSSGTQIQATTPSHIAGNAAVIVQESGQSSSSTATFTYNALTPTVSSISPNNGPTAGGTSVTITGANFLAGALVLFGSVPATNVTVNSATQIQAIAPANAAGTTNVTIQDPGNLTAALSGGYSYTSSSTGAPTITSVSPASGTPGTQVTITGTNFATADYVSFGSNNAPTTFVSATQLSATVPSVSTGSYNVTVTDPDPAAVTMNNAFTVTAAAGGQSILSGCSYIGAGGCSLPSGWTLITQQDFECTNSHAVPANPACGQLPPTQGASAAGCPSCPSNNFEATKAHGGSYAFGGPYTGDGDQVDWIENPNFNDPAVGSFGTVYLSWWEWTDSNATYPNSDYYLFQVENNIQCNGGPSGTNYDAQSFNVPALPGNSALMIAGGIGTPSDTCNGVFQYTGAKNVPMMAGTWRQVEVLYTPSTSFSGTSLQPPTGETNCTSPSIAGCGNGQQELWINGVLNQNTNNVNLNAAQSMANSNIQVGGVITDFCSADGSSRAAPFSKCPANAPTPFNRYFDDIIILKK